MLMGMDLPLTAVRRQIASGVDLIVHLGRLRDGSRKVLEIVELTGMEQGEICLRSLFHFEEEPGTKKQKRWRDNSGVQKNFCIRRSFGQRE